MVTASVGFHCPECTARARGRHVDVRAHWARAARPLVTRLLVGLNAGVQVVALVDGGGDPFFGTGRLAADGGLWGPAVADGEWWRIVTSGFLHAGLLHLAFNVLALTQLGLVLEPFLGRARFAALYALSLLSGSLGVLLLDPDALTVGASGAVFGLLGALLVVQRARGIDPWSSGLGGVLVVNLLITFSVPGISIGGHLGGLAGGVLGGAVVVAGARGGEATRATVAALLALAAAAFGACLVAA